MREPRMLLAGLATSAVLALSGCGDGGGGDGSGPGASEPDCLTPAQVQRQVDRIASGFEASEEEAEAKRQEIREVRSRACK